MPLINRCGGGGGNKQTIVVTVDSGSAVTATKGSKTVTGVSAGGVCVLTVPEVGSWSVMATLSGQSTGTQIVDVQDSYAVELFYVDPVLANNSWDVISATSEAGKAYDVGWRVGDTKTITVNGVSYVATIIDFNHDDLTSGGKVGITFQLQNCLATMYPMEATNINTNGWTGCVMRSSTMATLLSQLSSDLQSVIKYVNKLTSAGNQSATINTTSDKLFLLSEIEIFGAITNSKAGEGTQYAYYAAGNSKIKTVNGSASFWWERSPNGNGTPAFCHVGSDGNANGNNASHTFGVSFGFCV